MNGFITFLIILVIAGGIGIGIPTLLHFIEHGRLWFWPKKKPPPNPYEELYEAAYDVLCADIMENPTDWTSDGYRLVHETKGIVIWIANKDYGIDVSVAEKNKLYSTMPNNKVPSEKIRKAIWEAVQARNAAAIVAQFK